MNFVSKRYIIKIPSEICVIYCKKKNILLIKTQTKQKLLHLNVKLVILKDKNIIYVTNKSLNKSSNKLKKLLKTAQSITVSLIKQALLDVQIINYKKLNLVGVGYKVFEVETLTQKKVIELKLGYSHSLYYKIPIDIHIKVYQSTKLFASGYDLFKLSQMVANIRKCKTPEPYKGKGILYADEIIKLKEGKKV